MADAPVELDSAALNEGGSSFLRGFSVLPMLRQMGLLLALAASVAVGVSVVLWMREPDYKPLTGVANAQQANQIAELLQSEGFPYKLDHDAGMILVPADKLFEARMKIAGAQIPSGEQAGFELLDKDQGFGVSQFMEAALHRRSLEGELARSIMTIQGVRQARVHLGIPRATGFVRDQRAPTASVTVTLASGQSLGEGQVRAIMNLVAGAVPELTAEHVAVVDQSGRLLSGQDDDKALADADRQLRYTKQIESSLQDKIRNILLPAVGTGRMTAEVAADVDFTWVEETEELFNPDLPALRSEQTMTEQRVGDPADGGVPGALSNQPPAVSSAPETLAAAAAAVAGAANAATGANGANGAAPATTPAQPPHRSRSEATRNYELDRTISHTRHQVGRISRLTVAVVVDDQPGAAGENGQVTYAPWKAEDLERLSALVKNAIGYNAARGDTVTVVNSPFHEERAEPPEAVPFYAQTWFVDIVKQVLGALLLLALLFGLLRPLFKSLSKAGANVPTAQALARLAAAHGGGRIYDEMDGVRRMLPGAGAPYDQQLQAVRGIVADNPARVAQVVKHWVAKDE